MKQLNLVGILNDSGIGNAFAMHGSAIQAVADTHVHELDEPGTLKYRNTYFHGLPKLTKNLVRNFGDVTVGRGKNVAYWVWESSDLTEEFFKWETYFDEIWTCSRYCQSVLSEGLKRPVKLVPHYVTRYSYRPTVGSCPTFLVAFDGGSKFVRKNPVFAIRAFVKAFGNSKDVKLIVKARNVGQSLFEWMRKEAKNANVEFLTESLTVQQLDRLYSTIDFVFSPHTCEGFGLHLLEAMAFGKLVIASDYGGNKDFMHDDNSLLIPCEEVPVNDDYYFGVWGSPVMDDAVDRLREALNVGESHRREAFMTAVDHSMTNTIKRTYSALYD